LVLVSMQETSGWQLAPTVSLITRGRAFEFGASARSGRSTEAKQ
jgi:hypothetical protein